ncbi:helix-turn-helix domain-containing protein [Nocardioides sp. TRM66260-LWL]|uniref:helix-turn-helix domain-containing protein n=1 Tax=Nocardioides sp. TRM66260-LWL TaxID=2874478 RepID=UPI001CC4150D|nr:helix-turn-helix transcriptional regulator [Nocardioides sp. TRM66260-LWL]MBZ5736304.1 helix-turn-helix domain-containing protein [Nocardioides sp. TRM66260-LWL]
MEYGKRKKCNMTSQSKHRPNEMTLGAVLKQARIERGLTIAKLSQEAGIAVGQVHKLENDQVKKVNPAHLVALTGPLGMPMYRLFRLAGYPAEQVPLLEPELVRRLAELSPHSLNQITMMLDEWLAEHGQDLVPKVLEPVPVEESDESATTA